MGRGGLVVLLGMVVACDAGTAPIEPAATSGLELVPSALAFGAVADDTALPFVIRNTTAEALLFTIDDGAVSRCEDDNADRFCFEASQIGYTPPTRIGPSQEIAAVIRYDPRPTGLVDTATLALRRCPGCPPVILSMSAMGSLGEHGGLHCGPPIDLGDVDLDACVTRTITCANTLERPQRITGWALVGGGSDFAVTPASARTELPPRETVGLDVRYCPRDLGPDETTLEIAGEGAAPYAVLIRGSTPIAGLFVDPTSVDFGVIARNATAQARVRLHNNGTAPLEVSSVTAEPEVFDATSSITSLDPGQDDWITVTFRPTAAGTVRGHLRIASTAFQRPLVDVVLRGARGD